MSNEDRYLSQYHDTQQCIAVKPIFEAWLFDKALVQHQCYTSPAVGPEPEIGNPDLQSLTAET
jgi:hypothetical protein